MSEILNKEEYILSKIREVVPTVEKRHACQFLKYYEMLIEKNKVMNLTAITEFEEVVDKHFADSLSLVRSGRSIEKASIIDVGTGAGFPGIPLKILYPEMKLTLLDSLNKRIGFLQEVVDELQLRNVTLIHGRAEDVARNPEHREKYDMAVSRAVSNLATLSEYCIPFVKKGGSFIAYKSEKTEEELGLADKAVRVLGGKIEAVESFVLPGTDYVRTLVVIDKIGNTGNKYPRKAGLPSKDPIR